MSRPSRTISFDFSPLMLAMKPTPHESCSFAGSYSPCFSGAAVTSDSRSQFVSADHRLVRERQRDFIETCEQAFPAKPIPRKLKMMPRRGRNGHLLQIDAEAPFLRC